ncbi:hypothetical protein BJX99DRAFT_254005 [Aspergillus californicus]
MDAARGGINMCRIFFYAGGSITEIRKRALIALAYATARDKLLAPKAILIRSDLHRTTTIDGKYVINPDGYYTTISFKCIDQVAREYHVASHGYTNGKEDFVLKKATHRSEKPDDTTRGGRKSGKVVWPAEDLLVEYADSPIGYSHLPGGN